MSVIKEGMDILVPDIIRAISQRLGISNTLTRKLVKFALPALAAGFASRRNNSVGMNAVIGLGRHQPATDRGSYLDWLADPAAASRNSGYLAELLGPRDYPKLVRALAEVGGVSPGQAGRLLGLVMPAAYAPLRRKLVQDSYDAFLLAKFLEAEMPVIQAALPESLNNRIRIENLLVGAFDRVQRQTDRLLAAVRMPSELPNLRQISTLGVLTMLLALATNILVVDPAHRGELLAGHDKPLVFTKISAGGDLSLAYSEIDETLAEVVDPTSAAVALPRLNEFIEMVERLHSEIPEDDRSDFRYVAEEMEAHLRPKIEAAMERSNAADILRPVADTVLQRLEALS